jgi:hypothetical protein
LRVEGIVSCSVGSLGTGNKVEGERRVSSPLIPCLPLALSIPLLSLLLTLSLHETVPLSLKTKILSLPETALLCRFLLETRIKTDEAEEIISLSVALSVSLGI